MLCLDILQFGVLGEDLVLKRKLKRVDLVDEHVHVVLDVGYRQANVVDDVVHVLADQVCENLVAVIVARVYVALIKW